MRDTDQERIREILSRVYNDRVFSVEDGVVWVSGMNSDCSFVARGMARELTHRHDIPTSLVHDDDAVKHGGVKFNYGENA